MAIGRAGGVAMAGVVVVIDVESRRIKWEK
jgi:hypothetical protein